MEINVNEKVDFSYPEGYKKALESLSFLPEEMRESLFLALITNIALMG